jgi:hypothetical protein
VMANANDARVTTSWWLKLGTAEGAGAVQSDVKRLCIMSKPLRGCRALRRHVQEE